jgi:pre-mRNA-splicing factor ISY1
MARPEEKAQNMMNKWVKMREGEGIEPRQQRRPHLASLCEHLHDAEKWRRQIVREISDGIMKIQNPGMGEHAVRDLNDQINKLIREKWHWNRRIKELGGPDYHQLERRQQIEEGDSQGGSGLGLKGSGGYRYFGAAKDLPGVKELFARHAAKLTKRKRGDVYKYITPDYYGLRDEEDGVLIELEEEVAARRRAKLQKVRQEYHRTVEEEREKARATGDEEALDALTPFDWESEEEDEGLGGVTGAADAIAAHVAVPTQDIVAQVILDKKKHELLERLGG